MVDRDTLRKYGRLIRDYATRAYRDCLREPSGILKYKFIVPGSVYYDELWDWDSWLTDMAISEIADPVELAEYEYGCVLNFLDHIEADGKIPVWITSMQTYLLICCRLSWISAGLSMQVRIPLHIWRSIAVVHPLFTSRTTTSRVRWRAIPMHLSA